MRRMSTAAGVVVARLVRRRTTTTLMVPTTPGGTTRAKARRRSAIVTCCAMVAALAPVSVVAVPASAADGRVRESSPTHLTDVGGTLFFAANDGVHGEELWRSDGSAAGTVLVKDIHPERGSNIGDTTALGERLFFSADDGTHGDELWRSDGTLRGTRLVKDIRPGGQAAHPTALAVVGDVLLFTADDGTHGRELWRSDGTAAGTRLVKDIRPGRAGSSPTAFGFADFTVVGDTLHFVADDGVHGEEPWISDGTAAGTRLVTDLSPGRSDSLTYGRTAVGDTLYFARVGQLWRSDGTAAGTKLVKRLPTPPVVASPTPEVLIEAGGTLYLVLRTERDSALWASDGTTAGTREVRDGYQAYWWFRELGDRLAFAIDDVSTGAEPWLSDGTAAGTQPIRDIRKGRASSVDYVPGATVGDWLYFPANDGQIGEELWRSDGTAAGTRRVRDISPGRDASDPTELTAVGDILYFSATDGVHGQELWRSDGTRAGTLMVRDINAPDPRTRCTDGGGTVQVRRATWNTDSDTSEWVDLGRSVELCRLQTLGDEARSRVYVDLVTLASEGPTLASLAYLSRAAAAGAGAAATVEADPAAQACADLGGTASFGDTAAGGGWVAMDDPEDTVIATCVFADGSMIDVAGLADASMGTIRGADLSALFAYQPQSLPPVFRSDG
jgi:ELWxxDGT repeat protein